MVNEQEKTTVPIPSVGADGEQPIFDKSEMPVKKMIAGYIIKRIDVYADYQLHIELNMTIEQFDLGLDSIMEPEGQKLTS